MSVGAWLLLLAMPARAYESDQLAARQDPPADVTAAADAHADRLLALAVAETNRATGCRERRPGELRAVLAREIHAVMGRRAYVDVDGDGRPPMGFGAYAAWLEARAVRPVDAGLYEEVGFDDSPILHTFGPASTVHLAGQLVGTDKIDHFWVQGYDYFQRSRHGAEPARAVDWGTRTERGLWGLATTGVFSYADLAANYDGLRFYAGLLGPGSAFQRGEDGCVEQVRGYTWGEWIDWRYDEVLNPSVFRRGLVSELHEAVVEEAPWYCAAAPTPPDLADAPWVGEGAPSTAVAPDLTDLCAPPAVARAR